MTSSQVEITRQHNIILGRITGPPDWVVKLFVNNITPGLTTVTSDFVEATFGGYFPVDLVTGQWQPPVVINGRSQSDYGSAPLEWTLTAGPQTVYGYFVVNEADGSFAWGEKFATPRDLAVGAKIEVDLVFYTRNDPIPQ